MKEFLQPKSMLTPGIAGSIAMLITNTLTSQFGLWPNFTGLAISFLLGYLVFYYAGRLAEEERRLAEEEGRLVGREGRLVRTVYYVLNSLIIFSVAMGTTQAGGVAAKSRDHAKRDAAAKKGEQQAPFFANWLDGTVPERQKLAKDVEKLNEEQAKKALEELKIEMEGIKTDSKTALEAVFSTGRTYKDIAEFGSVMANLVEPENAI